MTTEEEAKRYIKDPNTRVFINYNDESGEWRYSVVVENSGAFWLDSFLSENEAKKFIEDNHLVMNLPFTTINAKEVGTIS